MSWFSKKQSSPPPASPGLSEEVTGLVRSALQIVDQHVAFSGAAFVVTGTGSEGGLMEAATHFEKAHHAQPDSAPLHYAYCSALSLAMQFKTARDEMEALAAAHPDFSLARWALAGWDEWRSPLTLLEWSPATTEVPPALSDAVLGCTLRPVREGINPRAAYFFRDRGGDLQDLKALKRARIDITTVVDEQSSSIPVVGIYARVWDNPSDALGMEAHELPLSSHGAQSRMACQYLTTQRDIDFVVLSADGRILLNRRMEMPERMLAANLQLAQLLDRPEGHEYERFEIVQAVTTHQQDYAAATVAY